MSAVAACMPAGVCKPRRPQASPLFRLVSDHFRRNANVPIEHHESSGREVLGEKDVVIFKVIQRPAREDFARLVHEARQVAKQSGMRRSDIPKAVASTRRA